MRDLLSIDVLAAISILVPALHRALSLSKNSSVTTQASARRVAPANATFTILASLSVCHLLNDMNQSLLSAIYPILKDSYHLDFGQIGLITLAFQLTASMLQPVVGMVTDRRPQPFSLPMGMGSSLAPSCCSCRSPVPTRLFCWRRRW